MNEFLNSNSILVQELDRVLKEKAVDYVDDFSYNQTNLTGHNYYLIDRIVCANSDNARCFEFADSTESPYGDAGCYAPCKSYDYDKMIQLFQSIGFSPKYIDRCLALEYQTYSSLIDSDKNKDWNEFIRERLTVVNNLQSYFESKFVYPPNASVESIDGWGVRERRLTYSNMR
jgi:hypothetical protein